MAKLGNGSTLNSNLAAMLTAEDIAPGDDVSYEMCKLIYAYHPLGGKMVDKSIGLAMSQRREIIIPDSPDERLREAFERKWAEIRADEKIASVVRLAKIYGASALVCGEEGKDTMTPLDFGNLDETKLFFNALDPMNIAGSLVTSQDPNSPDFQAPALVTVQSKQYHPSRTRLFFNEAPIYILFNNSSYGYAGRSVYQRAFFPLKSYIQTLIANDLVARKAGVLIARMESSGSIADRIQATVMNWKRDIVKESQNNNIISISPNESVESLNLMNVDGAISVARKHILEDIASACAMPSKLLTEETYAEGFGEGTEDAKNVIRYIENERRNMEPLYRFFDRIVMRLAWTPEFFEALRNNDKDYEGTDYVTEFSRWANAFEARWPSMLIEPESQKAEKIERTMRIVSEFFDRVAPNIPQQQKAGMIAWMSDAVNAQKDLFPSPLNLDIEAIADYTPPAAAPSPVQASES